MSARRVGWGMVWISAVAAALAQPGPVASRPSPQRYFLRVTADHVNLRTRADGNAMIVGQVDRDTVLEGRGIEFGWHRVVPPPGVFSLVSAQYVERSGPDRGVVRLRSGNLRVRAGSTVFAYDPLNCPVQKLLPDGAEVHIVGEQDGWLRITPPEGVFVYITDRYVQRISADEAARLRDRTAAAATRPATPITTRPRPAAASRPATQPAVAATGPATAPASRPALVTRPVEPTEPPQFRPFDATGELEAAFELPLGEFGLRYKLVAPFTRRVRAYIEIPPELKIDAPSLVGRYVGVRGEKVQPLTETLWLIRVRELTVLGDERSKAARGRTPRR